MSSLRIAAAFLIFATTPLLPAAAGAQIPRADITRPCAWLNPATKGYAFCLEQHLKRMRELAAESDVKLPVASTPEPRSNRGAQIRTNKQKRVHGSRDG